MATKKSTKKETVSKKGAKTAETLVVSQELFDLNAFLGEEGVEVGMTIELTKELKAKLVMPEKPKDEEKKVGAVKVPKFSCPVAILDGAEFVRIYEEGQEASAQEFLTKHPNFKAVDPDEVEHITVTWRETEKKRDESANREIDTGRMLTRAVRFSEELKGKNWMAEARQLASAGPKRSCTVKLAGE